MQVMLENQKKERPQLGLAIPVTNKAKPSSYDLKGSINIDGKTYRFGAYKSTAKGGGKLIVKEVFKKIKKSNHLNRLVTLSPLTEMATKFHTNNGAKLLQVNQDTQNFEYKVL